MNICLIIFLHFLFLPTTLRKPREFQEKILLKSGSAVIAHTQNKQNLQHIDISKFSVCKGLSFDDLGQYPWLGKKMNLSKGGDFSSLLNYLVTKLFGLMILIQMKHYKLLLKNIKRNKDFLLEIRRFRSKVRKPKERNQKKSANIDWYNKILGNPLLKP